MSQYIKLKTELSENPLPKLQSARTLYALVRLNPDHNQGSGKIPLDLRMVLDRSGSMAGLVTRNRSYTRLDVLKNACKKVIDMLEQNDRITIYVFDNRSKLLVKPTVIKNNGDRKGIKNLISRINLGGCTHMSGSLGQMLKVRNLKNYIQRSFIFTDGEVNSPSPKSEEKKCLDYAWDARGLGIPFQVYGTGIDYNDKFLQALAERSGGFYEHIGDAGEMAAVFAGQVGYYQDIAVTNLEMTLQAVPGVIMRKVSRVIPDICTYPSIQPLYFNAALPDLDRTRGAAYLIQMEITPAISSPCGIMDVHLRFDVSLAGLNGVEQAAKIHIDFTDDPALVEKNAQVMDAVTLQGAHDLTTLAAEKADTGQADMATRMMNQAAKIYKKMGDDSMSDNLVTLSNAVQQQGAVTGQNINIRRTLTTDSRKMITRRLTNHPMN